MRSGPLRAGGPPPDDDRFAGEPDYEELIDALDREPIQSEPRASHDRFPRSLAPPDRASDARQIRATRAMAGPSLELIGVDEIFAELPPIPYLLRELDICPGAPTLFAGLGFSAKTLLAHALGLAVACGAPAWGSLTARPGNVVLLDYEQGSHLTRRRIQRMARGMGLIPEGDALRMASMPSLYADDPEAEGLLKDACQGVTLCVIDSLSAACPSLEENSASARRTIDMLGRVSEATGCVIIIIHHAKKPSKDDVGGARNSIRGSGALFDAAGCVVVFARQADGTIELKHEKARTSGKLAKPMVATIEDTGDGGLLVYVETPPEPVGTCSGAGKLDAAKVAILAHLREHGPAASSNSLLKRLGGNRENHYAAIAELKLEGAIMVGDSTSKTVVRLSDSEPRGGE